MADLYESDWMAEMYDGDYAAIRTPSGDVDFYVAEARAARGPVLELGCGTGRILLPTARAGIPVTGVDRSAPMLRRLERHLAAEPREVRDRVRLVEADIVDADARGRFALVTLPFRPIAHVLRIDDQIRLLENARRHLAPEGRLLLDFFHPDPRYLAAPMPESLQVERSEGARRIRRYGSLVPHRAEQVSDVLLRWEIEEQGRITERRISFPMRWYHRFELEHLLARAGFEVEDLYGDFRGGPFADDSAEMVFRARPIPGRR